MKRTFLVCSALISTLIFTSCQSGKVVYKDPASNDGLIVERDRLNHQDFNALAEKMTRSLVGHSALDSKGTEKPVVMLGRIRNETSEHIQTDLIMNKVKIVLTNSNRARITSAVDASGVKDGTKTVRTLRKDDEFNQKTISGKGELLAPNYRLQGKIIQTGARAGKTQQTNFTFQLELVNDKTGIAEWIEEETIIKMGKSRASVGY